MTRHLPWLAALIGSWVFFQTTASGQELLVANNTANGYESILRFSSTGEYLGTFAHTSYRGGPVGLTFDSQGNLYVANHANNTVHRYSRTGADLGVFAHTGLNLPTGLAFNRAGQLVVCNYGDGSLSIYSAGGNLLSRTATGLLNPIALAVDGSDHIFVSTPNIDANSGVFRFSPDAQHRTIFAAGIDLNPRGLAFDPEGNLYVANQHGHTVQRYNPEGILLGNFASTGLQDPFALAFDAGGNLYISNQAGGHIRRYSPCGEDLGTFAVVPTALANPVGLAFVPVPEPTVSLVLLISAVFTGRWRHKRFASR